MCRVKSSPELLHVVRELHYSYLILTLTKLDLCTSNLLPLTCWICQRTFGCYLDHVNISLWHGHHEETVNTVGWPNTLIVFGHPTVLRFVYLPDWLWRANSGPPIAALKSTLLWLCDISDCTCQGSCARHCCCRPLSLIPSMIPPTFAFLVFQFLVLRPLLLLPLRTHSQNPYSGLNLHI